MRHRDMLAGSAFKRAPESRRDVISPFDKSSIELGYMKFKVNG
jgi:hypothetical protein